MALGTWYFLHDTWMALYVRKKAQRSTAQHRTAGQKAWHYTAPHGAALRR